MLTLIRCPFHLRGTAVARKRPRSFCQQCRWQVTPKQAYALDPTKSECADYASVHALCGNLSGNELTRNLSGNIRPQSSHLAEPLWTDLDTTSGICVRDLIFTKKKKKRKKEKEKEKEIKSAGGELMFEHSPNILASEEKDAMFIL